MDFNIVLISLFIQYSAVSSLHVGGVFLDWHSITLFKVENFIEIDLHLSV